MAGMQYRIYQRRQKHQQCLQLETPFTNTDNNERYNRNSVLVTDEFPSQLASPALTDDEEECASFLMTLKYRISPKLEDDIERIKRNRIKWFPERSNTLHRVTFGDAKFDEEDSSFTKDDVLISKLTPPPQEIIKLEPKTYTYDSIKTLVGKSDLLDPEDFYLVPDYIFFGMAQMRLCYVSDVDRVGCYKDRPIGFPGMCCKHCGGRPGSGKFYPSTVRGLAQTTTTQTILKHIGTKCRSCPYEVRQVLLEMQRNCKGGHYGRHAASDDPADAARPKYGSRKVFFERLWARLHDLELPVIPREAFPVEDGKFKSENVSVRSEICGEKESDLSSLDEDESVYSSNSISLNFSKNSKKRKLPSIILSEKDPKRKKNGPAAGFPFTKIKPLKETQITIPQPYLVPERRGTRTRKAPSYYQ